MSLVLVATETLFGKAEQASVLPCQRNFDATQYDCVEGGYDAD